jgi:hypothetical protein
MVRFDDVQLPRELRVVFVDRDAEYQVGAQTSQRLIGSSDNRQTLELPIVMTNAKARSVADTNIFTAWRERQRFAFRTSYQYADLEPTDVVDIAGENANYRVRLVKRQDDGMRINWEAVNEDLGDYDFNPLAATGPGDPQTPTIPSPPELFVMDIPVLRPEDDHAGVYVAVATEHDFDGAVVSKSADDTAYEQKATLTSVAAAGWCISALGDHTNQHATDEANAIEVFLYSGELATVSYDDMVDENANIAIVGREVVQFREFQGFSGNTFRLTGLRRGRLGTEHEIRDHAGGEPFVLLRAGTIANARMNQNEIGLDRYWKATPFGERIDQAAAYLERFNCNRLKPRAPTLEVLVRDELNDDWEFEGSRRTRYNGQWKNSIEVPLNEAYEQYVIRWFCAAEIGLSGIIYGNPTRLETPGPHGLVAGEYVYIFSAHNATFMVDRWGVILSVPASNLLYVDIDTRGRTTPLGGSSGRFSKMRVQRTLSTLVDSLTVAEQGGGAATRVGIVVTQISETMGEGFPLIAQRTQA